MDFTSKVDLGVVSLKAAPNTETSFTVRTLTYCLPPLVLFTTYHTPLIGSTFFQDVKFIPQNVFQ